MQLFISNEIDKNGLIKIAGADFFHIVKSIRKKINDKILIKVKDKIYVSEIKKINKYFLICEPLEILSPVYNNKIKINLFVGLTRIKTFENILKSCTELGVSKIYPIVTEYSQKIKITLNKFKRWQKIIYEASKQANVLNPPILFELKHFDEVIKVEGKKILFHITGDQILFNSLNHTNIKLLNIFIGAEGGFSKREIKLAQENKVEIVSLNYYNILRTETAVVSLISNILFYFNEIKNGIN